MLVSGAIRRLDASPDFTYFITCESLGNKQANMKRFYRMEIVRGFKKVSMLSFGVAL